MKYIKLLASLVLATILFLFPPSAQAASSSSITRSAGEELMAKDYSGQNLVGYEFTNVVLEKTNFSNADFRGGVFNGSQLEGVNMHGVDFSDGIAYLTQFQDADLTDAIFTNAMMLRSVFNHVDITGADFTDAILDGVEIKKLCAKAAGVNSRTGVDTRESLGCR
ncbi:pentapeptide repeat-containing protein [Chrysosporum bergii ANA360D]|uniref:Pentapeptide repeat-containing protein n=1 Tax=Chrysosporum bergii ANA360D TaxID=617107 RepID=A0AA43GVN9_9CYAN|nr:pentapeptide repeat-containing protein [Chrysosporum bergii]MDH6061847.1 pentapeptide repeat-containing protein [Chrysosporum bergii ANA360D]